MGEQIMVMAAAFGGILLYDWLTIDKLTKREKALYAGLYFICLYMGIDYVNNKDWFDIIDLITPVFGDVSKAIDDYLK
ncbi:hypothetical protein [Paenibacillus sinopodophylli]|uniref:hypothetical protein n=1 Tax=Paenibacillus sinopodophylli TaxID=1837342 RepID=UPI00110CC8F3|nr:hypothetical protein [Paenibacillus sinopodophylli]